MNWRNLLNSTYTNHLRYRGSILPTGKVVGVYLPNTPLLYGRIIHLNKHGMYEVEVPGLGIVHATKKELTIL